MGSGSGSELVQTTEPAIYIAKNLQKICMVETNNQRQLANAHEAQQALPESQRKYGPDGKHFSTLKEPQIFLTIECCGRMPLLEKAHSNGTVDP